MLGGDGGTKNDTYSHFHVMPTHVHLMYEMVDMLHSSATKMIAEIKGCGGGLVSLLCCV